MDLSDVATPASRYRHQRCRLYSTLHPSVYHRHLHPTRTCHPPNNNNNNSSNNNSSNQNPSIQLIIYLRFRQDSSNASADSSTASIHILHQPRILPKSSRILQESPGISGILGEALTSPSNFPSEESRGFFPDALGFSGILQDSSGRLSHPTPPTPPTHPPPAPNEPTVPFDGDSLSDVVDVDDANRPMKLCDPCPSLLQRCL